MAVFCIIYELKNTLKNYQPFFSAIKSTGVFWGINENTTFIQSDKDASYIRDVLSAYLAQNDKIMVIEVKKHWGARGYKANEYDWLKDVIK